MHSCSHQDQLVTEVLQEAVRRPHIRLVCAQHSVDLGLARLWDGKTVSVRGSAMLSTCSSFCDSYSRPWSPQYARGTTSSSRTCCCASTGGADAPNSHAAPSQVARAGQTAVDPGSSILRGLARVSDIRHTRYGGALASAGLAPLLALEVSLGRRTPASHSRGAVSNRDHVSHQPAVGHRTDPGRAAQVGHRRQQSLNSALSLARTNPLTKPDLAHVPEQPRASPLGG